MRNPFLRPETVSQWLLGSICWTGSCLSAWGLACLLLDKAPLQAAGSLPFFVIPVGFYAAHGLIWWRAVAGGRAIIRYDEQHHSFSHTRLAANLWLVALTLFQLACLLGPFMLMGWLLLNDTSAASNPY